MSGWSRDPILYRTATGPEHVNVSTTTISVVMGSRTTKQVTHTGVMGLKSAYIQLSTERGGGRETECKIKSRREVQLAALLSSYSTCRDTGHVLRMLVLIGRVIGLVAMVTRGLSF